MFRDTAAPSLDNSHREATDGMLVSSMTGPCCEAVTTRQTVVVPEVAADPKWARFLEFAAPLGIRSAWSTPILSNEGKVLGTFAHYYFETRDPSPRDKRMVELLGACGGGGYRPEPRGSGAARAERNARTARASGDARAAADMERLAGPPGDRVPRWHLSERQSGVERDARLVRSGVGRSVGSMARASGRLGKNPR